MLTGQSLLKKLLITTKIYYFNYNTKVKNLTRIYVIVIIRTCIL